MDNPLFKESERFKTFNGWPLEFVRPDELAKLGFYYLKKNFLDEVKCVFCAVQISRWQPGDIPLLEHKYHSKRCPFLDGREVGNVPLGADPREIYDLAPGVDVCGFTHLSFSEKKENELKPESSKHEHYFLSPKSMEFITYDSRLTTFKDWPKNEIVSPNKLAEAGFFHRELSMNGLIINDCVQCFHCGQLLNQWERGDDPWVEHAKHSKSCLFVQLLRRYAVNKGDEPYFWLPKPIKQEDCCVVCLQHKESVTFSPCQHGVCSLCVCSLKSDCPICRSRIIKVSENEKTEELKDEGKKKDEKITEVKSSEEKETKEKPVDDKSEEVKLDGKNSDEPKPKKTKPENTKPENTKPENTKPENTKPEETKPHESKIEEQRPEVSSSEERKPEISNSEERRPEKVDPQQQKPEVQSSGEQMSEESKTEDQKVEEKKPEKDASEKLELSKLEAKLTETKAEMREVNLLVGKEIKN